MILSSNFIRFSTHVLSVLQDSNHHAMLCLMLLKRMHTCTIYNYSGCGELNRCKYGPRRTQGF